MGTSTDAILFYGFHLGEDEVDGLPFGENTDFEDYDAWLDHLAGIDPTESPWRAYPDLDHLSWDARDRAQKEWMDNNRARIDSWSDHCRAARESITAVEMGHHCSDALSLPYFYACETTASRGYPESIESLTAPNGADSALRDLAERLGVEDPEIGWWLVSWWG